VSYVPLEVQAINFEQKWIHLNRRDPSPTELPEAIAEFRKDSAMSAGQWLFEMRDIIDETGKLHEGWTCRT
jgi:hypothetical protein